MIFQTLRGPLCRSFTAMGTEIELQLWPDAGQEQAARRALGRAARSVLLADRRLSRFRPDSELSRINRGEAGPVSAMTFAVIAAALEAARATGGLFDPTVHGAMLAAGYDRTFTQLVGQVVTPAAVVAPPARFSDVRLDARTRTVTLPPGVGLDLGGIAKGWLADVLAQRLARYGGALVDLGGDIAVAGTPPDADGWEIEIADPFGRELPLAELWMEAGGVATSGVLRRQWQTAAGWQHHLIDPRTGRPAESDVLAVTVVAPTATAAEVAAKAALLLGAVQGLAALDAAPQLAGLLVTATDGVVRSARFKDYDLRKRGVPCGIS